MKNTFFKNLVLMLLCAVSPSMVMAQRSYPPGSVFMCHISSERVLSSDRPIPECMEKEQRVFGPNGLVIDIIPPASELRAREQRLAQQKEEEQLRAAIAGRKDHLLFIYPDAAAHDAKRQQDLEPLHNKLNASNEQIDFLEQQLSELKEARAAQTPSLNYTKEREEKLRNDLSVQQHIVTTLRQQIEFLNKKYDEEKKFLSEYWGKN